MDIQTEIAIDLKEVATGVDKTFRFERQEPCDRCHGKGAEPGTNPTTCRTCGGYGQVERQSSMGFFVTRTVVDCPNCQGRGALIEKPCRTCSGSGRQPKDRMVSIKIPAGIQDGQSIRLRGEGEPGAMGTARGDLLCVVRVKPHPFFERDGDNLICRLPISFTQAALGATIEVPTLTGSTPIKIEPGTQHGAVYHLAGKGLPSLRRNRPGEEIVVVLIEIPKKLTKPQQELLRKFAASEDKSVLPESKGFFDRVKDYLTGTPEEPK